MKSVLAVIVMPLVAVGLFFTFGVPAYLERAPSWYFELPSVLPPALWAPAARVFGGILLTCAVLVVVFSRIFEVPDNTLLVMVQHEDNELLEDFAGDIAERIEPLKEKYGLVELSVLRGDYEFCLDWLQTHPVQPTIVIVSPKVFRNRRDTQVLLQTGVRQVYRFTGSTVPELVERFERAIHHQRTGYLS
jgi:hypothetical protein